MKLPSKFETARESPGFQLWRASNVWQRHMRACLKPLGLTHVQFVILAVTTKICESQETASQSAVAEIACIDKMMTSEVVRTLIGSDYLDRTRDPEDGRAFLLKPTDKGLAVISKALVEVENADAAFFAKAEVLQEGLVKVFALLAQE